MKTIHAVIILIIGFLTLIYSGLQKILHTPNADLAKYIAISILVIGTILFVITINSKPKIIK